MDPAEWIVLIVTVLVGGIAAGRRSIAMLAWLKGREVNVCLTCPKRGARAECTLVYDEGRKQYAGALRCSLQPGRTPRCEEACVHLLNRGFPIERATRDSGDVIVKADGGATRASG